MGVQGCMGAVVGMGMSTVAAQAMQLPHLAQPLMVMKMRQWCRWVVTGSGGLTAPTPAPLTENEAGSAIT
jgi:hypothetical protein